MPKPITESHYIWQVILCVSLGCMSATAGEFEIGPDPWTFEFAKNEIWNEKGQFYLDLEGMGAVPVTYVWVDPNESQFSGEADSYFSVTIVIKNQTGARYQLGVLDDTVMQRWGGHNRRITGTCFIIGAGEERTFSGLRDSETTIIPFLDRS